MHNQKEDKKMRNLNHTHAAVRTSFESLRRLLKLHDFEWGKHRRRRPKSLRLWKKKETFDFHFMDGRRQQWWSAKVAGDSERAVKVEGSKVGNGGEKRRNGEEGEGEGMAREWWWSETATAGDSVEGENGDDGLKARMSVEWVLKARRNCEFFD